jgi:hypothetical protein
MNGMSDVGASRLSSVAGDDADIGGHRPCDDGGNVDGDRSAAVGRAAEGAVAVSGHQSDLRTVHQMPVGEARRSRSPSRRLFLSEAGVDLSDEQQTKTKTALEYFAKGVAS